VTDERSAASGRSEEPLEETFSDVQDAETGDVSDVDDDLPDEAAENAYRERAETQVY
jgi:hypothetical protein